MTVYMVIHIALDRLEKQKKNSKTKEGVFFLWNLSGRTLTLVFSARG